MDVARIRLNDTCNLACAFCTEHRPAETPSFIAAGAVKARIDEALKAGAKELVLTGGEPTLRRDLQQIINYCADAGVRVVVETNATQIDDEQKFKRATLVRIHLPLSPWERGWGEGAQVAVGIEKLAKAGITLEASVPIVHSNDAIRLSLITQIKQHAFTAIVAVIPVSSPDQTELLTLKEAGQALEAFEARCRDEGIPLRLAGGTALPPCQLEKPSRLSYLFTLTRGGANRTDRHRVAKCESCVLADMCPGIPNGVEAEVKPLEGDKLRRRFSTQRTVEEQIERELITRDVRRTNGELVRENIVRVNFLCNQACRFCFVSTHLPSAKEAAIEAGILEAARLGGVVTLSGGEPTLNPRLVEYVKLAKREGAREVELQTNATKLSDRVLTESLIEAGVDMAFVSLHGSCAEISDVVTEAPGTFEQTARGLDVLHATKVGLRINFVFCQANLRDFPAFVRLVATRWPRAQINVSFVAPSTDVVPHEASLIPRYSDVQEPLREGLLLAAEAKLVVGGFDSMCGMPLCLVPADVKAYFKLQDAPDDRGEFVKPPACENCALKRQCFGLRRGYAELHGTSELKCFDR